MSGGINIEEKINYSNIKRKNRLKKNIHITTKLNKRLWEKPLAIRRLGTISVNKILIILHQYCYEYKLLLLLTNPLELFLKRYTVLFSIFSFEVFLVGTYKKLIAPATITCTTKIRVHLLKKFIKMSSTDVCVVKSLGSERHNQENII